MKKIRVMLYGVGAVGSMIAKFLLNKEGVEIVGAVDIAPDKVGNDLGEALGLEKKIGVKIADNVDHVISSAKPHVAVHATSSFLKDTFPQIASIVSQGVDVVSTCEELSYPYIADPKIGRQLDELAKKHEATVLGTGINPGFLMDTLVLTLTAACQRVDRIEATRVINASTRRLPFQRKVGMGLTVEEFKRKISEKEITGHVGLEQSIAMVANALGWNLDRIVTEPVQPVIAQKAVSSKELQVDSGNVAGLSQRSKGIIKGKEAILLDFQAYADAEEFDEISIVGVPPVKQRIQPCVHGDAGTVAIVVNMIPKVIEARAGLLTMKDLPVPSATLGDLARHVSTI